MNLFSSKSYLKFSLWSFHLSLSLKFAVKLSPTVSIEAKSTTVTFIKTRAADPDLSLGTISFA